MNLDIDILEEKSEILKTLGHPLRLSIIQLLQEHEKLSVTDIFTMLEIEQAVASHHLRLMKRVNIVEVLREGKNAFYSLSNKKFADITNLLFSF